MSNRAALGLAWTAGAASIALAVSAAWIGMDAEEQPWKLVLMPGLWAVPGTLIAAGRPGKPLGWLMIGVGGLFAGGAFATQWVQSGHTAGADYAIWLADRGSAILVPLTLAVLLLLPDGSLPSSRWRLPATLAMATQLLLVSAWCLVSGPAANPDSSWPANPSNPVGVLPAGWSDALDAMSSWILQVPLLLGVMAVAARLRRRDPDETRRMVDVLAAMAVFVMLVVIGRALWPTAADVLDLAGAALLATVVATAALRRRLEGVEVVVRHAFVYAVLTTVIALGYVSVVAALGGLGRDLPTYGVGVVAAVIALLVLPLRTYVQRAVTRAMYGDVTDPVMAVRRLTSTVADAAESDDVLSGLTRAVAASMRARRVTVEVDGRTSTHGVGGVGAQVRIPLTGGGMQQGTIMVELPPGRRFRQDDLDLMTELADHGGRAVHAVQLADELRTSRQMLVTAREEERARLRRDLHDELGPTLAGLAMQLGGLEEVLRKDPVTASARLVRLEGAARQALDDVRRLSRELRPPSLDELGLVGAILRAGEEAGLAIDTTRSRALAPLSAAVEVAAYRIGVEAVLNVARHSGVRRAQVEVHTDGHELVLCISDVGKGIGDAPAGVGILSMRERAHELGGLLTVGGDEGTVVEARLPLPTTADAAATTEVAR